MYINLNLKLNIIKKNKNFLEVLRNHNYFYNKNYIKNISWINLKNEIIYSYIFAE